MYSIVTTSIVCGIESILIQVEADISEGLPVFEMVGFLSAEVKEAKERVRTALKNSGYLLPAKRITINLSPANIRKSGTGFDLAIAVAVLTALGVVSDRKLEQTLIVGELGLNGRIQPIDGILPMIAEAKERGISQCILPELNRTEAQMVSGIRILGMRDLKEVIAFLNEGIYEEKEAIYIEEIPVNKSLPDFSEINGQKVVKRACETAVSGMHNLLMIGPPGAGKSMIASRIPTILPPMEEEEKMELSKIYSVCGMFREREKLLEIRPFRSPHHTITAQGLAGGGQYPKPGEISLAHKGVLFLDELPEFQKSTLEILRQPMEEKKVHLVRMHGNYTYPADFMLVAAMNPCSCGYYPDRQKCRCSQVAIERYLNKISQPLLDRIDICVEAAQISYEELNGTSLNETSEQIRERVKVTLERQKVRFRNENFFYNSQIPSSKIKDYCKIEHGLEEYLKQKYQKLNLTARSYHKVLKVARTLADMEECQLIQKRHLEEAFCYRSLERKFWENGGMHR
ncbi:MAG: YifB family Mg chelatase-like AAA ATPase [Roseburia sp.]